MSIPFILKPKKKFSLCRIGKNFDGGYLIGKSSLKDSELLISLGIYDDWSFEEEFKKNNKDCSVICYDDNNILKLIVKKFIESIIYFPIKLEFKALYYFKKIINYIKIKKNFSIHQKKIFYNDLNNILADVQHNNIFLKIDIEGSEYRLLDEIIKNQKKIKGMVIEFHDFDYHREKICNFVKLLTLELIHIHPNNFSLLDKNNDPLVIELTFERNPIIENNKNILPDPLDMKNNPDSDDIFLNFEKE